MPDFVCIVSDGSVVISNGGQQVGSASGPVGCSASQAQSPLPDIPPPDFVIGRPGGGGVERSLTIRSSVTLRRVRAAGARQRRGIHDSWQLLARDDTHWHRDQQPRQVVGVLSQRRSATRPRAAQRAVVLRPVLAVVDPPPALFLAMFVPSEL